MRIESPPNDLFDSESESEDELIDVKKNNYYNNDDDSNVVNFNKNSEEIKEVKETILYDSDNTTSDNNEDAKNDKV